MRIHGTQSSSRSAKTSRRELVADPENGAGSLRFERWRRVSGRYELQVDAVGMEALRNRLRIIEQAPSMRGTIERSSEEPVTALV